MTLEATLKVPKHYLAARKELDMLVRSMRHDNPLYERYLLETRYHRDPPLRTDFWKWVQLHSGQPKNVSTSSLPPPPPVPLAASSRRVLFVGTSDELAETYTGIVDSKNSSLVHHLWKGNVVLCHDVLHFWGYFFGHEDMLDLLQLVSVPSRIYSTGKISAYAHKKSSELYISDTLASIADAWEIPLKPLFFTEGSHNTH